MKKGQKVKAGSLKGGKSMPSAKAKPGSGARFRALESKLDKQGVKNPSALASVLGRAKYTKEGFQKLAKAGRKKSTK